MHDVAAFLLGHQRLESTRQRGRRPNCNLHSMPWLAGAHGPHGSIQRCCPPYAGRTTTAKDSPSTRTPTSFDSATEAGDRKKSRRLWTNLPTPIPLSHRSAVGADRRFSNRCTALGIHRSVRLACHVHPCQQSAPRLQPLRSHMRGALVAQSTRQVKRATLLGRPMVEQHGMVGAFPHHNSEGSLVASMGTAHRCARTHHEY